MICLMSASGFIKTVINMAVIYTANLKKCNSAINIAYSFSAGRSFEGESVRGGTAQSRRADSYKNEQTYPLSGECFKLPCVIALAFPLPPKLQSLDDGILYLLGGRPRRKEFADFLLWQLELLYLIWFFFLHDG